MPEKIISWTLPVQYLLKLNICLPFDTTIALVDVQAIVAFSYAHRTKMF